MRKEDKLKLEEIEKYLLLSPDDGEDIEEFIDEYYHQSLMVKEEENSSYYEYCYSMS